MSRVADRHRALARRGEAHRQIDEAVPLAHRDIERRGDSGLRDWGSVARTDRDRPGAVGDRGVEGCVESRARSFPPARRTRRRRSGRPRSWPSPRARRRACRRRRCSRSLGRASLRGRVVDGDGAVEAWPAGPPNKTETSALPSFSSTTASRTNSRGVGTIVSLSTMLTRLLALEIDAVVLGVQVEGEGLEPLDRRAVDDLHADDLGRLPRARS